MDSGLPSVSVILLTYNRADVLNGTIESILRQTAPEFELIIADDASPDHTEEICQRWAISDNRIRYCRWPKNVGMPQSVNLGILASSGKYVAILHDDDVYSPVLLEKWRACLDKHPNAAFVFNSYCALDMQAKPVKVYCEHLPEYMSGRVLLEEVFFRRWLFDSPVWGTVMMRRSAFDHAGSFDERYSYWADVDMWMRLADDFDVCYIDEPLIGVASREASPHQFADSFSRVQPLLERMFWEARMRHYHARRMRRFGEAIRHWSFAAAARAWQLACEANSQLRSMRRSDSKSL
jgi:glycosyltransferase involved in cell wall biosynthesis